MPLTIQKNHHDFSECICGGDMISKRETIVRVVREKEITLHNIEVTRCLSCEEIEFNLGDNVGFKLAEAYRNNISDIIFD